MSRPKQKRLKYDQKTRDREALTYILTTILQAMNLFCSGTSDLGPAVGGLMPGQ